MLKNSIRYIVVIFILYTLWAIGIPLLFKLNVNNIENLIQKASGYKIEIINPKLNLWIPPYIKIKAETFKILNKDSTNALFIENPKINIKLIPLLIGKVSIKSFESKNIQTQLKINSNIYLGDYLIKLPKQKNVNTNIDRLKIKKYDILLLDKKSNYSISLKGENVYFKQSLNYIIASSQNKLFVKNSESKSDFDIKIPKKHFIKNSKINLNITNLKLEPLTNILQTFIKDEIISLDGEINMSSNNSKLNGEITNFKLTMKDEAKSIIFPDKFTIDSEFIAHTNDLKIRKFIAKGDDITAELKGQINQITSTSPYFNIQFVMPESDVRKIALLLPPVVVPQFNVYRLKMYPFYGKARANIQIKGKFPEPTIDGNINISDAYLIKPIPNADKATINIKCEHKKMNVDVVVPAGNNEIVYVNGDIEDYGDNKADLRIRSSKNVDLATAEFVLNPLHQILRFLMGPVPIMDITGKGNIDIRVIGSKKNPHIWGDFNFKDTSASFNDIKGLILTKASGKLTFIDQDAHFINKTGTVNNQSFTVDGKCNLFGNIDFDVISNNQPIQSLINTINSSPMLEDIKSTIPNIQNAQGCADLKIKLTGKLPNIYDIRINENLFVEGNLNLHDNSLNLNGLSINKLNGLIGFKCFDINLELNSILDDLSRINITGDVKKGIANIIISSPKLNLREFTKHTLKEFDDCFISLNAKYQGKANDIEIDKIECNARVLPNDKPTNNIKILTGNLELKNSKLRLNNISGFIKHNPFNINLNIDNLSENLAQSKFNGDICIKNFDLKTLNYFKNLDIIPTEIKKELNNFEIIYGNTDIIAKVKNNKINSYTNLTNIGGVYTLKKTPKSTPLYIPIKLINGQIVIKNNRVFLNKMNCLVDNMPVLIYGNVNNIFQNPKFDIHINSKLVQRTFDKYWNIDNIYPIKIKGDILLGSFISGTKDKINTRIDLKLEEKSNIYYMGATVGDTENPITVNTDFDISKNNIIRLNKFQYSKLISSQNNKQNLFPLLTVKGGITYINNSLCIFDNLIVKTEAPTDARIFNIIFRKPTIKNGQFTSDLKINGKSISPKILGKLDISELDMPFLNTHVKDLSLNFKDNDITVKSKGEVLSNNIILNAKIKNKFTTNYIVEKADIAIKELDINRLLSELKQIELKTFGNSQTTNTYNSNILHSLILKDLTVQAESVNIKNIKANNLKASCSLNDRMLFSINNFIFDIAEGNIQGNAKYNLLNNIMKLNLNANNVNANEMMIAILDVPNQIFGKLTGKIELITNILNEQTSKETLCGKIIFTVKDGRMPKLGSLEYLLKAGNTIKSGITGITMNSIIDLVTPLKTGEFSSINGNILINKGIAENIEIHSESKDLNLFIKGKYNIITEIADMKVLGQLSRKISTAFGTIGNLSINSLFNKIPGVDLSENSQLVSELNKIPGIELSNKSYRKFIVEITGNINNENNVKSFKWIN